MLHTQTYTKYVHAYFVNICACVCVCVCVCAHTHTHTREVCLARQFFAIGNRIDSSSDPGGGC